jgi:hypothetical protein
MDGLILVLVALALVLAVAYGLFTVRGSGINLHRHRAQGTPGSAGPAEETGVDRGQGSATGSDLYGRSDPQHGTQ